MAETDDSLERLNTVVNEIEAHTLRLVREAKLGRATPASLMQELSETAMPLMRDFAVRIFAEVLAVREYIHKEVEPAIMRMGDGVDESILMPEDGELLTRQLLSYRELLEGLVDRAAGDDRAAMAAKLAEVDTALARVAEITADDGGEEPGDPDGGEDDDPEAEGDEDEGSGAGAN
jgi:hypothetical protein